MDPKFDLTEMLVDQIQLHWTQQVCPRMDDVSDAEYLFDPTSDGSAWTLHDRDEQRTAQQAGAGDLVIDFAYPEPVPAPFTTIAWRLGHVIVGVLAVRNHSHFGASAVSYQDWEYPDTAVGALEQLDHQYELWIDGVRGLGAEGLAAPCGDAEGHYAQDPMIRLVLHIHRELIHHLAEVALLRDLFTRTR